MSILFISCGMESGIQKLIGCLRERAGYKCFNREELIKEISHYGEWATVALTQLSQATSSYHSFSRNRRYYLILMRQALLEKIFQENIIYYGFSGHLLIPHLQDMIRVRVSAPLKMRVSLTMEGLGCDESAARKYISRSDAERVCWARFVYGIDVRNAALYDLSLNLGHLSLPVVCDILENILLRNNSTGLEKPKARVEQLLLAANVEAELIIDPRTRDLEIDARMDSGCIRLTGPYLEYAELAVVMEIARKVTEGRMVEYIPGYASQHRLEDPKNSLVFSH